MTGSSARKPSARPSNIALKCYSDSACVMFWHGRNYACGKFFPQTGLFAKSNPFVFSCPRLALKLQYLRADEVAQSGCASGISARILDSVALFLCHFTLAQPRICRLCIKLSVLRRFHTAQRISSRSGNFHPHLRMLGRAANSQDALHAPHGNSFTRIVSIFITPIPDAPCTCSGQHRVDSAGH